eukprot:scaffold679186_cov38-Prasinocladus_malaysianus.AAC.1
MRQEKSRFSTCEPREVAELEVKRGDLRRGAVRAPLGPMRSPRPKVDVRERDTRLSSEGRQEALAEVHGLLQKNLVSRQ